MEDEIYVIFGIILNYHIVGLENHFAHGNQ